MVWSSLSVIVMTASYVVYEGADQCTLRMRVSRLWRCLLLCRHFSTRLYMFLHGIGWGVHVTHMLGLEGKLAHVLHSTVILATIFCRCEMCGMPSKLILSPLQDTFADEAASAHAQALNAWREFMSITKAEKKGSFVAYLLGMVVRLGFSLWRVCEGGPKLGDETPGLALASTASMWFHVFGEEEMPMNVANSSMYGVVPSPLSLHEDSPVQQLGSFEFRKLLPPAHARLIVELHRMTHDWFLHVRRKRKWRAMGVDCGGACFVPYEYLHSSLKQSSVSTVEQFVHRRMVTFIVDGLLGMLHRRGYGIRLSPVLSDMYTIALGLRGNNYAETVRRSLFFRGADLQAQMGVVSHLISPKNKLTADRRFQVNVAVAAGVDGARDISYQQFVLFLWAVLVGRVHIAMHIWANCEHPVIMAVVASTMFRSLSKGLRLKKRTERNLETYGQQYAMHAMQLLQMCEKNDSDMTRRLLLAAHPWIGGMTCVDVAFVGAYGPLMRLHVYLSVLYDLWMGELDAHSTRDEFVIAMNALTFGIFAPFTIRYRPIEMDSHGYGKYNQEKRLKRSSSVWLDGADMAEREPAAGTGRPSDRRQGRSLLEAFKAFHIAPITRYYMGLFFFLAFTALYSYVTIRPYSNSRVDVITADYIVAVWVVATLVQEIQQLDILGWQAYVFDKWNMVDLIITLSVLAAFAFKFDLRYIYWSRAIYALLALLVFARITRFYGRFSLLGPKLHMIRRMFQDILVFVFLMILALVAFGVAVTSLLAGNRRTDTTGEVIKSIWFRPYWQIFGELALDELQEESGCMSSLFGDCGDNPTFLIPYLLALYLFFSNVLMLNLVIAMFGETYGNVQDKGAEVWAVQNYSLLEEYRYQRLPAPLNIVLVVYDVLLCVIGKSRKCLGNKSEEDDKRKDAHYRGPRVDERLRRQYLTVIDPECVCGSSLVFKLFRSNLSS